MTERFTAPERPIRHYRRTDQITQEIKGWVVRHDLQSGERLPKERELMTILRCSRGTVREALKILEAQGFVEIFPGQNGGARIAKVSYQHASQSLRNYFYFQPLTWAQVYRVRERLEPFLAADVVDDLDEDDFADLESTLDICRAGLAGEVSPSDHRAAELEFHQILCRACTDPMLKFMGGFINDLLSDFAEHRNVIDTQGNEFAEAALRYHSELLDAYRERDRARVEDLMKRHIHDAGCIVAESEGAVDGGLLLSNQEDHSTGKRHVSRERG